MTVDWSALDFDNVTDFRALDALTAERLGLTVLKLNIGGETHYTALSVDGAKTVRLLPYTTDPHVARSLSHDEWECEERDYEGDFVKVFYWKDHNNVNVADHCDTPEKRAFLLVKTWHLMMDAEGL